MIGEKNMFAEIICTLNKKTPDPKTRSPDVSFFSFAGINQLRYWSMF